MARFVPIGERIHCVSPEMRAAMASRDPGPILHRAEEQLRAGAEVLDVNIGPASSDGEALMAWLVKLLQSRFDNVPLSLDTVNRRALEAGLRVYDRSKGKPIVNGADAGGRIDVIDLATDHDAVCIAMCAADGMAEDNDARMRHCETMLARGLARGMDAEDLWFDPQFIIIKGMQERQMEVLEAIRLLTEAGLRTTCGLSNASCGMPAAVRPVLDSAMLAMAMGMGLSSAILNPCEKRVMETVKSCGIIRGETLYADAYLEI